MTSTSGPVGEEQQAEAEFVRRSRPRPSAAIHLGPYFIHRPRKVEHRRQGYPRLAAFINSDKDFVVFRAFGELHSRLLLNKQDEITELEERLNALDKDENMAYYLSSRRYDPREERKALLLEAETKLNQYNVLLQSYFRQVEKPKAGKDKIKNVRNWLEGNKPLIPAESTFFDDWDDLISPGNPADKGGLEHFLEKCVIQLMKRGFREASVKKSDDHHVLLFSHSRITTMSRILTTLLAIVTVVGPIFVLIYVRSTKWRIWIIALFTSLFSSSLCSLTQSRNYEIFSATAAFCAVMVVFVGSLPNTVVS